MPEHIKKYLKLVEGMTDHAKYSNEELKDLIRNSDWIDDPIYRGTNYLKKKGIDYREIHVPSEGIRSKPLDVDIDIHNAINVLSQKWLGIKIRNGLFCTTNIAQAESYGSVVLVLPLKGGRVYSAEGIGDYVEITDGKYSDVELENYIYHLYELKGDDTSYIGMDYGEFEEAIQQDKDFISGFNEYLAENYLSILEERSPDYFGINEDELIIFGDVLMIERDYANSLGMDIIL